MQGFGGKVSLDGNHLPLPRLPRLLVSVPFTHSIVQQHPITARVFFTAPSQAEQDRPLAASLLFLCLPILQHVWLPPLLAVLRVQWPLGFELEFACRIGRAQKLFQVGVGSARFTQVGPITHE